MALIDIHVHAIFTSAEFPCNWAIVNGHLGLYSQEITNVCVLGSFSLQSFHVSG